MGLSAELARQLVAAGVVDSISASTIRRILQSHQLKPWQHHLWLSPKVPEIAPLPNRFKKLATCTRKLKRHEIVMCIDEKTSLQPVHAKRPLPAQPRLPVRVEHEYQRKGALNLFAAHAHRQSLGTDI